MKYLSLVFALFLTACGSNSSSEEKKSADSTSTEKRKTIPVSEPGTKPGIDTSQSKEYSNARFRKVTVQKVGENSFRVRGQGQIFEANFNWVIEDGHEELAKGYQMTDAGAPEWGNFDFTVKASKKRENSTLHLLLFESSAKDGSRVDELMIPL